MHRPMQREAIVKNITHALEHTAQCGEYSRERETDRKTLNCICGHEFISFKEKCHMY